MKKETLLELIIASLFTFCGGFADAYTLVYRGGVYSNMQTGNLVKLCIGLANGSFEFAFFFPILFFCLGILIAVLLKKIKYYDQIVIISLIIISVSSAFMPKTDVWRLVSVCSLSVSGAMQFEAFRECLTIKYTNTMCTNNMRLLMESAVDHIKNKQNKRVFFFLLIVVSFCLGAFASTLIGKALELYSISIISVIYLLIFMLRSINLRRA